MCKVKSQDSLKTDYLRYHVNASTLIGLQIDLANKFG